jgi:hypothetical protein
MRHIVLFPLVHAMALVQALMVHIMLIIDTPIFTSHTKRIPQHKKITGPPTTVSLMPPQQHTEALSVVLSHSATAMYH